ncbi:hypothetical protein EJ357_06970 [Streptomyces cyaneochromogenes]|uniref:Uncharacterized protein n=1 Tax=Streptomyces cyaneochromogenes TaxID=2496836 RepID=A0A3S9M205_9ACTN|nr:hypothetical protein EJ357_06970 [Streptomyces cyaneochromogenes]
MPDRTGPQRTARGEFGRRHARRCFEREGLQTNLMGAEWSGASPVVAPPLVSHHSSRWAWTRCTSCPSRSGGGAGEVSTSTQGLSSHGKATTQHASGRPWRPTVSQYVNLALPSGWCSTVILVTSERSPSAVAYERLRACSAGVCSSTGATTLSPRPIPQHRVLATSIPAAAR